MESKNINNNDLIETTKEEILKTEKVLFSSQKFKVAEMDLKNEDEYPFLSECLTDFIHEKLKEKRIKFNDINLNYSLSNSQGDGVCFTGTFIYKGLTIKATHTGFYYHERSKNLESTEYKNKDFYEYSEKMQNKLNKMQDDFNAVYMDICREAEKNGYSIIEEADKELTLRGGLIKFCEINDFPEMELFDLDYKEKEEKGYILIAKGQYYNLYIKDFEMIKENKRIIEAKSYTEIEYKV